MITFIDDTLGFPTLHFLQSKADVVTALQDLVTWAEAQTGYHLCSIRLDQGGDYINQSLNMFLSSRGIEHQTSVPCTPQQNSQAEHFNWTILQKSEVMHQHACLPPSFLKRPTLTKSASSSSSNNSDNQVAPRDNGKSPRGQDWGPPGALLRLLLELSDCVIWTNPCMYMYMRMYVCKHLYNIYGLSDRWDAFHWLSLSPGPQLVSAPSQYQLLPYSSIALYTIQGFGCMYTRLYDMLCYTSRPWVVHEDNRCISTAM